MGLNVDYESIYFVPLLMRGFDDYDLAWEAMTASVIASCDRIQPKSTPDPKFDCGDRVWWVLDDTHGRSLSLCDKGWIHAFYTLPLEDSDEWSWQYFIFVDEDSLSGDRLHYCLVWEHELLERVMAHFSSKSSQYVNSGQF